MARLKKSSKQWMLLELGVRDPLASTILYIDNRELYRHKISDGACTSS